MHACCPEAYAIQQAISAWLPPFAASLQLDAWPPAPDTLHLLQPLSRTHETSALTDAPYDLVFTYLPGLRCSGGLPEHNPLSPH